MLSFNWAVNVCNLCKRTDLPNSVTKPPCTEQYAYDGRIFGNDSLVTNKLVTNKLVTNNFVTDNLVT